MSKVDLPDGMYDLDSGWLDGRLLERRAVVRSPVHYCSLVVENFTGGLT